ncbi:cytochrome c [Tropicimonas sp. TH_r6]|uniref:c-type cytochrome n=1 Tax=Tropicimonas sp. TH_r6 TaxID=3082085 RepID=UPI002952FBA7|nr:cytochrome c [Tropicimonas sp. TH_r6]MDV7144114.1 cytochrome c [Tropicimonas sp. TH_r6]
MNRLTVLILIAAAFPALAEDVPSGKDLYRDNCVECHGDTAQGDDDISPDIRGATRTQLERALPGFDQMPEFAFTDAEVVALKDYLAVLE